MNDKPISNINRNDSALSIPSTIMFTSFNIEQSKVRIWGEKIDTDFRKLFDAIKLIEKIDGILSVRKRIQIKKNTTKIDLWNDTLDLPELDLKFINKLKHVIQSNYQNSLFDKSSIASLMAVSKRHLNRKVKKMIALNPIDLLRDYRLLMAEKKLLQGIQVGIVSDLCGFNSNSYFCSCFKKKYGLTPKSYQQKARIK